MKEQHEGLHLRAVTTAKEYLKREAELIGIFQELDQSRAFEHYGMPSLFAYSTKVLGLSEATTTALTSIARAARKVPEFKAAIEEKKISFSNARRIAPVLKTENKQEWLEKATKLQVRVLELELAKSFPERAKPTRMYPKSEFLGRLEVDLPHATLAKLKRAQELLSQKKKANIDAAKALEFLLDEFIERFDPVAKAQRTEKKLCTKSDASEKVTHQTPSEQNKSENQSGTIGKPVTRPVIQLSSELLLMARRMGFPVPRPKIPATEKHKVILRDRAQCTHLYPDGSRCDSRQWLEHHHLQPRSMGGVDVASNLLTLCSKHHRFAHRS